MLTTCDLLSGDREKCKDINECKEKKSPCDPHATCKNTDGSYICSCNAPFWDGNGTECRPTASNKCGTKKDTCKKATEECKNTAQGGVQCSCKGEVAGRALCHCALSVHELFCKCNVRSIQKVASCVQFCFMYRNLIARRLKLQFLAKIVLDHCTREGSTWVPGSSNRRKQLSNFTV